MKKKKFDDKEFIVKEFRKCAMACAKEGIPLTDFTYLVISMTIQTARFAGCSQKGLKALVMEALKPYDPLKKKL